ncbi:MAG: deoxyribodipyrimidine photo-lyase [Actinomycetes bacterium]
MTPPVVLFTRDLRLHDNPTLAQAVSVHPLVIPLFVLDDRLLGSPNRTAYLLGALRSLRDSLGGALVVRRGDVVDAIAALGASAVYVADDASAYATRRLRRLRERLDVHVTPGSAVVAPGDVHPVGGDHYRVFTPYWNAWSRAAVRPLARTPAAIELPPGIDPGEIPALADITDGVPSPELPASGETAARALLSAFVAERLAQYDETRNGFAPDATSGLSTALHFGCISAVEVARRVAGQPGTEPFLRQLCWRDFSLQLLAARPDLPFADYRPRGDRWNDDEEGLLAWREGVTGYPIVDASMRQLLAEGWMPGRARLLAASFLVKHLRIDWRAGAAHFMALLVDGDVASNSANWQWVAGTGTDTRPNRMFNPVRQAHRFDPDGAYVRRYVPELAGLSAKAIHEPWTLGAAALAELGYPAPIVDHAAASAAFAAARTGAVAR